MPKKIEEKTDKEIIKDIDILLSELDSEVE